MVEKKTEKDLASLLEKKDKLKEDTTFEKSEKNRKEMVEIKYVNPKELKPSKYKFTKMNDTEYEQLKASIQLSGFSKRLPIKVREINGELEIVNGHHRNAIALELKIKQVPIEIYTYSKDTEAISDAIQSNKDMGGINYFEVSKAWEDVFGAYEKGKHGVSQEDIGKLGGGFKKEMVGDIRPIYTRLKDMLPKGESSPFSNYQLLLFARVENDKFRRKLVEYSEKLSSDELQEKATLCNKISEYIEKKVKDDKELMEKVYDALLDNNIVFKDSLEALQQLIDEMIGQPVRYQPRYVGGNALEILPTLDSESIHLVVTSPPYGSLKDYKAEGQITSLTGYNRYLTELKEIWENCFRILVPGGRLIVIVGDEVVKAGTDSPHRVIPIHAEIIKQNIEIGYNYMSSIIWQKINVNRPSGGGAFPGSYPFPRECLMNQDHENILIFRKPGDTFPESLQMKEASRLQMEQWSLWVNSIWDVHGQTKKYHPAPFPVK